MNEEEKREARGIFLLPLGTWNPPFAICLLLSFPSEHRAHNSRKKRRNKNSHYFLQFIVNNKQQQR